MSRPRIWISLRHVRAAHRRGVALYRYESTLCQCRAFISLHHVSTAQPENKYLISASCTGVALFYPFDFAAHPSTSSREGPHHPQGAPRGRSLRSQPKSITKTISYAFSVQIVPEHPHGFTRLISPAVREIFSVVADQKRTYALVDEHG